MVAALLILSAYLIGSISFAFFAGHLLKGIDLRQHGSKNLGATNTSRELGAVPGVIVLLLDVAKGVLAVWLASAFIADVPWWLPLACGLAAIAGHNWPFYLRFQGGKGVATALGVMLTIFQWPLLCALAIGIAVIAVTRYVSLGSMIGALLIPIFIYIFEGQLNAEWWFSVVIAVLVVVRHHSNIRKLLNGTESKLNFKKKNKNGA